MTVFIQQRSDILVMDDEVIPFSNFSCLPPCNGRNAYETVNKDCVRGRKEKEFPQINTQQDEKPQRDG